MLNFRYRFLAHSVLAFRLIIVRTSLDFRYSLSMLSPRLPFHTRYIFASFAAASLILISSCQSIHDKKEITVEILHTNDMHSHFAGSKNGSACITESYCEGGYGRVAEYVKEVKERNPNAIFLDAGDQFQGSLLYVNYHSPLVGKITNKMQYDFATFGNHEFDEGCKALSDYAKNADFPFLAVNLKPAPGCPLSKNNIAPFTVIDRPDAKIGIIGLANPDVVNQSKACKDTKFVDPFKAVKESVKALQTQKVNIIIVLSHLGLPFDEELAKTVSGVDLIVGGHTHDYIGPGSPLGPYPIVERSPSGKPVLIVTTSGEAKFLGHLEMNFNKEGIPTSWNGEPVRLGKAGGSPEITKIINQVAEPVIKRNSTVVGTNLVKMRDGLDPCREGDCLSAMVTTDAMLDYARPKGAVVALINGGNFRAALPVGKITQGDIDNLLPFKDKVLLRKYTGKQLFEAVEHGVSDVDGIGPRMIQASGLRYTYCPTAPVGHRVRSVEVQDRDGKWNPLDDNKVYVAAVGAFLASGGDDHKALADGIKISNSGPLVADALKVYLKKKSPINQTPEPRISALK